MARVLTNILNGEKISNYKIIAFDMDGTLLNGSHEISEDTLKTINLLKNHNVVILLATGRMASGVTRHLNKLGTPGLVVAHNGAVVKDIHKNKIYLHNKVPKEILTEVQNFKRTNSNTVIHINIDDDIYVEKESRLSIRFAKELGIDLTKINSFSEIKKNPTSILLMEKKSLLDAILMSLQTKFPDKFDYVLIPWFDDLWQLQLLPHNTSKGAAVLNVAKSMGIKKSEIISFGDSYNDLEMVKESGLGIAMGNAVEDLKNEADYVTLSNIEDGISVALKELIRNE